MKLSVIGAGNMGGAIVKGVIAGHIKPEDVTVCDKDESRLKEFEHIGVNTTQAVSECAVDADVVIIAVKPDGFDEVLSQLAGNKRSTFVSIAAGISIKYIKGFLGDVKVVRTMPNTPALLGEGITAVSVEAPVNEQDYMLVEKVLNAIGMVERVDESLMDAVVALNGSSPAYVYMVIEAMVNNGVKAGVPAEVATRLAAQSVVGAAKMVLKTGESPEILRQRVCSPNGTTLQAVDELNKSGLYDMFDRAMERCSRRSRELSK